MSRNMAVAIGLVIANISALAIHAQVPRRGAPTPQSITPGVLPANASRGNSSVAPSQAEQKKEEFAIAVSLQPSPMKELVERVSRSFGVPVSFEEPAWSWMNDVMLLVDTPALLANPAARRNTNPKMHTAALGSLDVRVPIDRRAHSSLELAATVLEKALTSHTERGNPGAFRLVNLGELGFSIVPARVRDQKGASVDAASPLDTRISFPREERSVAATLILIGNAVSAAAQQRVGVDVSAGGLRIPVYQDGKVTIGAQNEIARNVLAKTLREIDYPGGGTPKYRWNLDYQPDSRAYTLTFWVVTQDRFLDYPGIVHGADDMPRQVVSWPAKPQSQ